MLRDRPKPGVTLVTISGISRPLHSDLQQKHRQGMSTKVTPINQSQSGTFSPSLIHSSIMNVNELSTTHRMNNKPYPISMSSSSNKSLSSFENNDDLINTSNTKLITKKHSQKPSRNIENNKTEKRNRRRGVCEACPPCSTCCCLASLFGSLLLLVGLIILAVYLLPNDQISTTMITTTSTSDTTSTITTSTSTTSKTQTTSTSSTSTTSTTTTTSTSTTSSTTTTTSPTPPCAPSSVGSSSVLFSTSSSSITSYTCLAYTWTSPTTGLVTLAFQLRNDPDYWYLDDVSVYAGGNQMLTNGGFETGSLSPWIRTTPNGVCTGVPGSVSNTSPHSGTYGLHDGSNGCADQISQQFTATAGQVYTVSFWLKSGATGSVISAMVTLS